MALVAGSDARGLGIMRCVAARAIGVCFLAFARNTHEVQVFMAVAALLHRFFVESVWRMASGARVMAFEGGMLEELRFFLAVAGLAARGGFARCLVRLVAIFACLRAERGFFRMLYILARMAIEAISSLYPRLSVRAMAA